MTGILTVLKPAIRSLAKATSHPSPVRWPLVRWCGHWRGLLRASHKLEPLHLVIIEIPCNQFV